MPAKCSINDIKENKIKNIKPIVPSLNFPLTRRGNRSFKKIINKTAYIPTSLKKKILLLDNKKKPVNPKGKAVKKDTAKKSNSLADGRLLSFIVNAKKEIIPTTNPPIKESPGKYGNNKKIKGLKKLELGFKIIKNILAPKKENITVIIAMLNTLSVDTSFLKSTKSSLVIRYKLNKNMRIHSNKTSIKKCINYSKTKIIPLMISTKTPATVITLPTPKISASPPAIITGKKETAPTKAYKKPNILPLISSFVST